MASLKNLFGSPQGNTESNDALRFVAPKERTAKQQLAAASSTPAAK